MQYMFCLQMRIEWNIRHVINELSKDRLCHKISFSLRCLFILVMKSSLEA